MELSVLTIWRFSSNNKWFDNILLNISLEIDLLNRNTSKNRLVKDGVKFILI